MKNSAFLDVTLCGLVQAFRRNISPKSSRSRCKITRTQHDSGSNLTCFLMVSCLSYSSTLKMEAVRSSETLVNFYRTIWRYIP
jgi:hypothetical protein